MFDCDRGDKKPVRWKPEWFKTTDISGKTGMKCKVFQNSFIMALFSSNLPGNAVIAMQKKINNMPFNLTFIFCCVRKVPTMKTNNNIRKRRYRCQYLAL